MKIELESFSESKESSEGPFIFLHSIFQHFIRAFIVVATRSKNELNKEAVGCMFIDRLSSDALIQYLRVMCSFLFRSLSPRIEPVADCTELNE